MGKNPLFSSPPLGGEVKMRGSSSLEGELERLADVPSRTVAEPIAREVR